MILPERTPSSQPLFVLMCKRLESGDWCASVFIKATGCEPGSFSCLKYSPFKHNQTVSRLALVWYISQTFSFQYARRVADHRHKPPELSH